MKTAWYRWLPWLMIVLSLGGLLLALLLAGAQSQRPSDTIVDWEPLPSKTMSSQGQAHDVLTIAIAPVVSALPSIERYRPLVSLLGERLEMPVRVVQRESYSAVNQLLAEGGCDLAFICTYAFILGQLDKSMDLLVVPQIDGKTVYHCEVVVPAKSVITSLADCRGRRFASADPLSTTGWIYPASRLRTLGIDPDTAFSEHLFSGSHDKSIDALLNGRVDAIAVDAIVWHEYLRDHPADTANYRTIHRSPDFGMPPLVHRYGLDSQLMRRVRAVLLHLHESDAGSAVLREAGIDRFVEGQIGDYEAVVQLAHEQQAASGY